MEWSSKVQNPRQTRLSFCVLCQILLNIVLVLMSKPTSITYFKMQQDITFYRDGKQIHLDHRSVVICKLTFFHLHWPAAVLIQCLFVAKNNRLKETSFSRHNTSCKAQCLIFFQKYFSVEKKSITVNKSSYVDGSVPLFFLSINESAIHRLGWKKQIISNCLSLWVFAIMTDWSSQLFFLYTKLPAYFIRSSRLAQIKPEKRTLLCEWV